MRSPDAQAYADPMEDLTPAVITPPGTPGPGQQCTATNKAGNRCGRWAIAGGMVCPKHGGAAPQVREAARRRLLQHAPMAIRVLHDVARDANAPAAARVRAAGDILDRAGLKAATEIEVTATMATNADLDAAILAALEARGLGA
jgi:hypothetical protein